MVRLADRIRSDRRVAELELTPDIFVTLRAGFHYDGAHCFGEDTITAARRTLGFVRPCGCEQCQREKESAS